MTEEEKERKKRFDITERPRRYDIFSDWMNRPMNEMERLFDEFETSIRRPFGSPITEMWKYAKPDFRMPLLDVHDKGDHYMIEAELPGVDKEDIELECTDENLKVKAEVKRETKEEGEDYVRHERGYRSFYRNIPLPEDVISEEVDATFVNGVLKINLPKKETEKEEKKGKKIEVK